MCAIFKSMLSIIPPESVTYSAICARIGLITKINEKKLKTLDFEINHPNDVIWPHILRCTRRYDLTIKLIPTTFCQLRESQRNADNIAWLSRLRLMFAR